MLILLTSLVRSSVGGVTAAQFKSVERKNHWFSLFCKDPFIYFFCFKGEHVSLSLFQVPEKEVE